jgi:hypothetical protein
LEGGVVVTGRGLHGPSALVRRSRDGDDRTVLFHLGYPTPASGVLRPLFVRRTDKGLVVDGLLVVAGSPVDIPTTWRLRGPLADGDLDVLGVLQTWVDEDAAVDVDFTELHTTTPSITFSDGEHHFRLALTAPTAPVRPR